MGMSGEEKAAALLLSLDEEVAADVMKRLAPDEIRRVGKYMAGLSEVANEDIGIVAREFCLLAKEKDNGIMSVRGSLVEGVASKALGEVKGKKLLKTNEDKKLFIESPIIENLRNTDTRMLINSTKMEHPQTVALLLAHLRPEQTAEIMEQFPPDKQEDIAKRIATLGSVPREFMEDMVRTLESEMIGKRDSGEQIGGARMLAEILNRMSQSNENRILESIEDTNAELAADIRNLMFTFDDILELDNVSMRVLLEAIDREVLACALKIIDSEMRGKIFKNMSKRAAEMLKEDIEVMPPKRLSEVEKNQRTIIETAKKLKDEEKITIAVGNEDDILV
ncbi:MAG: flagellar motor switch protein FliG [Deltaproteobacteria bacterium]|nr:flagellar motor switch protein FliG [Deltaproteobacteria bacterium]